MTSNVPEAIAAVILILLIVGVAYVFGRSDSIFLAPTTVFTVPTTISSSTTVVATYGTLGETAGDLGFAIQPGEYETLQLNLSNSGNRAINVTVVQQGRLTSQNANAMLPIVMINPISLTIMPGSTGSVGVTIFVPYAGNTNGTVWEGLLSSQCISGCSGGVAKVLTVDVT